MAKRTSRTRTYDRARFGQFDRSFVLRVIRNYLVSVLALLIVLLGVTYALFRYQFETEAAEQTRQTAQNLANDVTSIMINEGGPVASRTVYPILQRNYDRLGYDIAVIPSDITVESIEQRFNFHPEGVAPEWPDAGEYHQATVTVQAQEFCLRCHVTAEVGDPLGDVVVRNYFGSYSQQWREDAVLSGIAGMINIIISTLLMFFVMRLRMEPVLKLRAMVSRWAKGAMPLEERIEVKTDDEFGELAHDLNLTLDRIGAIRRDLRDNSSRQIDLNEKIGVELERISEIAHELHNELQSLEHDNREARGRALEQLKRNIDNVRSLCEQLHETLRSQQVLMKRLE